MDLLSIARKIWRHRLATLPVLVLTLVGAVYVMAIKEPVYEASSSYILINPPAPPTAEQIARNPALARINADNPYTRFADQSVLVDVLARTIGGDSARERLVEAGADPRYDVAPSSQFGFSSPIVQVTGVAPSAEAAMETARLVSKAVTEELDRMQRVQRVHSRYRVTPLQVDSPDRAQLRASGQLRALIGVLALGVILLFVVVSVMDGLQAQRTPRSMPSSAPDGPWPEAGLPQAGEGQVVELGRDLDPEPAWRELLDTDPAPASGRGARGRTLTAASRRRRHDPRA
jgi:hypothetical protein